MKYRIAVGKTLKIIYKMYNYKLCDDMVGFGKTLTGVNLTI